MTYVIELHTRDGRTIGSKGGTHEGHGTVARLENVWPRLESIAHQRTWYRAYVIFNTKDVTCVIARDAQNRLFRVGHTDGCTIGSHLPYMHELPAGEGASGPNAARFRTKVVSKQGAIHFQSLAEREAWLTQQFTPADVATAVLLHAGRVYYAWERHGTSRELVANGRRDPANVPKYHNR